MAKLSTIEIANKQRHVLLLGKVKENKALTRAELVELKKYERQAAGKITARMTSKVPSKGSRQPSKKKKTKAAATKRVKKKAGKKKAKKKRKAGPPVDEAEVLRLGLECENRAEADAMIKTHRSLKEIFKKHPQIRQAWDRGRFLRYLRGLARAGANVTEAAKKLGFANGRGLRAMIDEDDEVGELWNQTQTEIFIDFKTALFETAKEGNPAAIKAVQQNFLLDEKERPGPGPDLSRITKSQLAELTGKNLKTIYDWHTKCGLPCNADKTFDLGIYLAWHDEFLLKKFSVENEPAADLDPLKAAKAEMITLELAKRRGELLDRELVMGGLLARHQIFISWADHRADELSRLCRGQKPERIAQLIKEAIMELRRDLCKVPEELRLPDIAEKLFQKTLESLK